jgi:transcriptional regulator with XRE-family HTH domain
MSDFRRRVDNLLKKNNLNYQALIESNNWPQSTVSGWKRRNIIPPADKANEIAKSLHTTVEYLVTGELTKNEVIKNQVIQSLLENVETIKKL